jgi:hypothetical protein
VKFPLKLASVVVLRPSDAEFSGGGLSRADETVHHHIHLIAAPGTAIDRSVVRGMVENLWRLLLVFAARINPEILEQTIMRFQEQIAATAALMHGQQSEAFLRIVDEEREILLQEHRRNPDALKRRLGLPPYGSQYIPQRGGHPQQSLSDVVVRTAIRATVWESVIELFRAFR